MNSFSLACAIVPFISWTSSIVILSSVSDHNYRMEILKLSVQYYILKPVNKDYFYMTIKNMIDFVTINRRVSPLTGLPR